MPIGVGYGGNSSAETNPRTPRILPVDTDTTLECSGSQPRRKPAVVYQTQCSYRTRGSDVTGRVATHPWLMSLDSGCRVLCKAIPCPVRTPNHATPSSHGDDSRTEREPEYPKRAGNLAPLVSDRPAPNVRLGNPRRCRAKPDCLLDLRSRSVYAAEDITGTHGGRCRTRWRRPRT